MSMEDLLLDYGWVVVIIVVVIMIIACIWLLSYISEVGLQTLWTDIWCGKGGC